ncbi:MAG: ABC transporter permease [Ancrocorticia sp.]
MNQFGAAFTWLTDLDHWHGAGGIPTRIVEHLGVTALAVFLAALVAIPLGILIGHTRRGAGLMGAFTGAARAIPTLGILTLFGLALGIGLRAPLLAFVILAIPSLLAGTYAGIQAVDPTIPNAAKAIGMSPWQVIRSVEIPLALPVILGGLRSATLQVVSTATLAAYVADAGLGRYLFAGLKSRDYAQMLAGALLVTILALLLELILALCQRFAARRANPAAHSRLKNPQYSGKDPA